MKLSNFILPDRNQENPLILKIRVRTIFNFFTDIGSFFSPHRTETNPFTLLQYIKAESPKFMTKISAFFSTEIDIFCFISRLWNEKKSVIQNLSPLFFSLRQVDEISHRLGSFFTPHLLIYAVGFAALYPPYENPHRIGSFFTPHLLIYAMVGFAALHPPYENPHRIGSFFTPHLLIYAMVGFAAPHPPYENPHRIGSFFTPHLLIYAMVGYAALHPPYEIFGASILFSLICKDNPVSYASD